MKFSIKEWDFIVGAIGFYAHNLCKDESELDINESVGKKLVEAIKKMESREPEDIMDVDLTVEELEYVGDAVEEVLFARAFTQLGEEMAVQVMNKITEVFNDSYQA